MEKTALFPQVKGILHGGDYNPEQWLDRPDILEEDIRLMKKAGINSATLGVFSWSVYEPVEGEFHFDWLQEIMDRLYENGIYTILATPSGARPAWLDAAYPEAMRVSAHNVRDHHGNRHNHCMSSPIYRKKTAVIDRKLAERFGSHPGLIMWHISNELGGECFCPLCAERFREYLADKFDHDIEKLNQAWWTTFWSHRYNSFDQIEPPFEHGERSIMGLNLEWKRFTSWNMNDFMRSEIDVLKEITPDIPVTANFMELFYGLNYRNLAKDLDVISWDSYPRFHNDYETFQDTMLWNAFQHALMRSLKPEKPFMLMESTPSLVNWHPFNKLKRPGVHKLACIQALACGSDTVQYFQWRKGRGSFEQFHGAVVDHNGSEDTRVFREVAEVGQALCRLSPVAGSLVRARAALLFDWDNRWAIHDAGALSNQTKKYEDTCMKIWQEFRRLGVEMDVVASDGVLDRYDVVVAPMLYMLQPGTASALRSFVEKGGQLLATYFTGYVDENQLCYLGGFPGNGLSELFGIVSEEIDTLYPSDRNGIRFEKGISGKIRTKEGVPEDTAVWEVKDYAEILRVKDAKVLGVYTGDFYQGTAAVTCKEYPVSREQTPSKCGRAYYVAARVGAGQMRPLFEKLLEDAGIRTRKLPENVDYCCRTGEEGVYEFYLNYGTAPVEVPDVHGTDLLTGEKVEDILGLGAYGVAVLQTAASPRHLE